MVAIRAVPGAAEEDPPALDCGDSQSTAASIDVAPACAGITTSA